MNINLIIFLLILFLSKIDSNDSSNSTVTIIFDLINNKISRIKNNVSFNYNNKSYTIEEFLISTYLNESILNCSLFNITERTKENEINYFNIKYRYIEDKQVLNADIFDENIPFKLVNIYYNELSQKNYSILSINNFKNELILFDINSKSIIISNEMNISDIKEIPEEKKMILSEENLCYKNFSNNNGNRKFICKLDYLLFGHEDLKKDDVYLAKQIDEKISTAYLDNLISYNIFPYEFLDYFFTSFFSELNDGCSKNVYKTNIEGKENVEFHYITCPKNKIDIYTKRRKLSLIINKFSYRIQNLFVDSFDFLKESERDTDTYYFNILFQKDRDNFVLGFGFISQIMFLYYNKTSYIYSGDRINYTKDLTDDSSTDFEKWLYVLTAGSFTLLLLIFTIIGCFHSKRSNSELKEMLKLKGIL